jgi:hypothetical protein
MGARASVASLLLSIVIVVPCMRKNICVPTDQPVTPAAPARPQPQQPSTPVKPASTTPEHSKPCTHRADMHAKAGHEDAAKNKGGRSS